MRIRRIATGLVDSSETEILTKFRKARGIIAKDFFPCIRRESFPAFHKDLLESGHMLAGCG